MSMERIRNIDEQIENLKKRLETVEGTRTEVYTRIVGYYRSLKNWNRGKREEYKFRKPFVKLAGKVAETQRTGSAVQKETVTAVERESTSFAYFYRERCPNCPPMREMIDNLALQGTKIDVDEENGFAEAARYNVTAAPTVIFFDRNGTETFRTSNITSCREFTSALAGTLY